MGIERVGWRAFAKTGTVAVLQTQHSGKFGGKTHNFFRVVSREKNGALRLIELKTRVGFVFFKSASYYLGSIVPILHGTGCYFSQVKYEARHCARLGTYTIYEKPLEVYCPEKDYIHEVFYNKDAR